MFETNFKSSKTFEMLYSRAAYFLFVLVLDIIPINFTQYYQETTLISVSRYSNKNKYCTENSSVKQRIQRTQSIDLFLKFNLKRMKFYFSVLNWIFICIQENLLSFPFSSFLSQGHSFPWVKNEEVINYNHNRSLVYFSVTCCISNNKSVLQRNSAANVPCFVCLFHQDNNIVLRIME